jgi:chromosome segregation ATPase
VTNDEFFSVLTRYHHELMIPEVERLLEERISGALRPLRSEMCDGFDAIYQRFDRLEKEYESLKAGLRRLEERVDALDVRLTALERRMTGREHRMTAFEGRALSLEERMTSVEEQLTTIKAEVVLVRERVQEKIQTGATGAEYDELRGHVADLERRVSEVEGRR